MDEELREELDLEVVREDILESHRRLISSIIHGLIDKLLNQRMQNENLKRRLRELEEYKMVNKMNRQMKGGDA